ncbi:MAG: hypothetical protein ABIH92_00500 [Nanoarchaeota archaeon]
MSSSSDNTLLTVAIIAVLVSAGALFLQVNTIYSLERVLLDPADDQGTAIVEIASNIRIDFTFDTIDWGAGYVTVDSGAAVLDTAAGTVTNWEDSGGPIPPVTDGFIVENIGNEHIELSLSLEDPINNWIPQGITGPVTLEYQFRPCGGGSAADCSMGASDDDNVASCTPGGGFAFGTYYPINVVAPGDLVCDPYLYLDVADELRIDLRLTIPEDTPSTGGAATNHLIADIVLNV